MLNRVYIGLGGNLGDSEALFLSAMVKMGGIPLTNVVAVSSLYKTPPMGPADQGDYTNAVVALDTGLEPMPLLDALQEIEGQHGRERKDERWGERTLDLDILLFGTQIVKEDRLVIPHYGMAKRVFVIKPLLELVGEDFQLPILGRLGDLYAVLATDPIERLEKN